MSNLADALSNLIYQYPGWGYLIVGGSMLLQGEIAVLVLVYLVLRGALTWPQYIIPALTVVIFVETMVYVLGRNLRGMRIGWRWYRRIKTNKRVQIYSYYLKKNIGKLMIIGKFLPAGSMITLLLTGWSRIKFWDFFRAYIASMLLWFSTMTVLAYFIMTGVTYLEKYESFHGTEFVLIAFFILLIGTEHFVRKSIHNKMRVEKEEETEEEPEDEEEKSLTFREKFFPNHPKTEESVDPHYLVHAIHQDKAKQKAKPQENKKPADTPQG